MLSNIIIEALQIFNMLIKLLCIACEFAQDFHLFAINFTIILYQELLCGNP
jgi:hypothetical protein